jgi:hypothetical protein
MIEASEKTNETKEAPERPVDGGNLTATEATAMGKTQVPADDAPARGHSIPIQTNLNNGNMFTSGPPNSGLNVAGFNNGVGQQGFNNAVLTNGQSFNHMNGFMDANGFFNSNYMNNANVLLNRNGITGFSTHGFGGNANPLLNAFPNAFPNANVMNLRMHGVANTNGLANMNHFPLNFSPNNMVGNGIGFTPNAFVANPANTFVANSNGFVPNSAAGFIIPANGIPPTPASGLAPTPTNGFAPTAGNGFAPANSTPTGVTPTPANAFGTTNPVQDTNGTINANPLGNEIELTNHGQGFAGAQGNTQTGDGQGMGGNLVDFWG